MYSINGNDITLTRGDSMFVDLTLTKDGEAFTPEEGSSIRFAMKKKYTDADSTALVINIPIDTLRLAVEPDDTKSYQMGKTYVYDIQYTDASGNVDTFISGTLTLTEEAI